MSDFHPLVSIVIPVYNGANYVAEAIESALAQTYDRIEIIVVNDGSLDDTEEKVRPYFDRIRYFAQPNGGVSSALNLAIKEMKGEYFSWLSHDDLYYPHKIATEIDALRAAPDKNSLVLSNWDIIDAQSVVYRKSCRSGLSGDLLLDFLLVAPVNGCAALIPRRCFSEAGNFDLEHRYVSDYDLFFRFAQAYPCIILDDALVMNRCHRKQMGQLQRPEHVRQCNWFLIKALGACLRQESSKTIDDVFLQQLAFSWQKRGYRQAARHALSQMSRHSLPLRVKYSFHAVYCQSKRISRRWLNSLRNHFR